MSPWILKASNMLQVTPAHQYIVLSGSGAHAKSAILQNTKRSVSIVHIS